jgi:hypothetical protein
MIIRSAQLQPETSEAPGIPDADPMQLQAAQLFDDLAAARVPSVRAIRARLHVGQSRAQGVRTYLATLVAGVADPKQVALTDRP